MLIRIIHYLNREEKFQLLKYKCIIIRIFISYGQIYKIFLLRAVKLIKSISYLFCLIQYTQV